MLKELKVSQSELLYMYVNFWPLAKGGTQNRGHGFWKYIGPRLVKNLFYLFPQLDEMLAEKIGNDLGL